MQKSHRAHSNIGHALAAGLLMGVLAIGLWPTPAWSQDESRQHFSNFTLYWENDVFAGTDRDYTNGLKLTWSTPFGDGGPESGDLPRWAYPILKGLPFVRGPHARHAVSLSLGQNIFTPDDTKRSDLIVDDRPYASYAYLGVGFHVNGGRRRDVWEFNVGVVGPLSMGQESQDFVHDIIDSPRSGGWEHQLKNEPALEAIYETKWRLWSAETDSGFGFDFIPHLGGRVGNVAIYANAGAEFRFGWYVPRNFGSCTIRPGCDIGARVDRRDLDHYRANRFGVHFFTGVDGRYVVRDIFLDGNTFQDSHSVDRENFVADLIGGLALSYGRWRMSYAYVMRTREFKQRDDDPVFGALTLSFAY